MRNLQPIIIRRTKKRAHATHTGAWKIAYADFVTAMMAFFMLMWLLGSTTHGDLKGIASYFNNPMKVALTGGRGTGDTSSITPGGGQNLSQSAGQVVRGNSSAFKPPGQKDRQAAQAEHARVEAVRLTELKARIEGLIANNPRLAEYRSQIRIDTVPEGLRIQIVDEQNRPMFDVGSALVKPSMRDILRQIGAAMVGLENQVSLAGHTDLSPYGRGERGYSNWELSADRANASRRELVAGGMPEERVRRVLGLAASDLHDQAKPFAAVNRRISIVVLNRERAAPPSSPDLQVTE